MQMMGYNPIPQNINQKPKGFWLINQLHLLYMKNTQTTHYDKKY